MTDICHGTVWKILRKWFGEKRKWKQFKGNRRQPHAGYQTTTSWCFQEVGSGFNDAVKTDRPASLLHSTLTTATSHRGDCFFAVDAKWLTATLIAH